MENFIPLKIFNSEKELFIKEYNLSKETLEDIES